MFWTWYRITLSVFTGIDFKRVHSRLPKRAVCSRLGRHSLLAKGLFHLATNYFFSVTRKIYTASQQHNMSCFVLPLENMLQTARYLNDWLILGWLRIFDFWLLWSACKRTVELFYTQMTIPTYCWSGSVIQYKTTTAICQSTVSYSILHTDLCKKNNKI